MKLQNCLPRLAKSLHIPINDVSRCSFFIFLAAFGIAIGFYFSYSIHCVWQLIFTFSILVNAESLVCDILLLYILVNEASALDFCLFSSYGVFVVSFLLLSIIFQFLENNFPKSLTSTFNRLHWTKKFSVLRFKKFLFLEHTFIFIF